MNQTPLRRVSLAILLIVLGPFPLSVPTPLGQESRLSRPLERPPTPPRPPIAASPRPSQEGRSLERPPILNSLGRRQPRLVVLIAIDQFRYDYLERFRDLFGSSGFNRLVGRGANFTNARYSHAPTYTAPGHAVISTGAQPSTTGIVGNAWYDRESGQLVTSVSDSKTRLLGAGPRSSASPSRLLTDTIGDELRLSNNCKSRVVSISIKDRAAILLGGKLANGAFWFDEASGRFVSSDYYFESLPDWVQEFNRTKPADKFFNTPWRKLLPDGAYARSTSDDEPYEIPGEGDTRTFPHDLRRGLNSPGPKYYRALLDSPYGNSLVLDFARAAVTAERLGMRAYPDLLTVGLSSNDFVGHAFGPYSQEVEDITVRTDRMISEFLSFLDRRVGLDRYSVVLTADHGVSPAPEFAAQHKLNGRRIPLQQIRDAMDQALRKRLGEGGWIAAIEGGSIYLNRALLAQKGLEASTVAAIAGEAALTVPGIARYFTPASLQADHLASDFVASAVANGFHPARSGDLILVMEPFTQQLSSTTGTSHGSPYSYDSHVPLILCGPGIRAGRFTRPCGPIDIAPTLAVILNIESPAAATGQPLREVLQ